MYEERKSSEVRFGEKKGGELRKSHSLSRNRIKSVTRDLVLISIQIADSGTAAGSPGFACCA